ncbi:MAG: hypothetical protein ACR2HN_00240, partial [Tepidiformaceae bacterium]
EEEYRETFREAADARLRRGLVLARVVEAEALEPSPEDIDGEVERMIGPMGDDGARLREYLATAEARDSLRRNLVTEKTLERISAIAAGEAEEATV